MLRHIRTTLLTIILTAIGSLPSVAVQEYDEQINLKALYQQIDQAIEQHPHFVAEREKQIDSSQNFFYRKATWRKRCR